MCWEIINIIFYIIIIAIFQFVSHKDNKGLKVKLISLCHIHQYFHFSERKLLYIIQYIISIYCFNLFLPFYISTFVCVCVCDW